MLSKSAMRGRLFSLRFEPRPKHLFEAPGDSLALLLQNSADARFGNSMSLRQLIQTQATFTISQQQSEIYLQRFTPIRDLPALPAHACPDTFDDDAPFQFRHRRHDDDDGSAQRAFGVYRLSLRKKLNAEPVSSSRACSRCLVLRAKRSATRPRGRRIYGGGHPPSFCQGWAASIARRCHDRRIPSRVRTLFGQQTAASRSSWVSRCWSAVLKLDINCGSFHC